MTRTLLLIAGAAGVVLMVIIMGAFVQSMAATMRSTGEERNAIILGLGSEDFMEQSEISAAVPSIAAAAIDTIERVNGRALMSPEILHSAMINLPGQNVEEQTDAHKILVRGVLPDAFRVHPQVSIVEGDLPGPGEILVGGLASTRLNIPESELAVGKKLLFENREWTISGRFNAAGTAFDAEIWCQLEDLKIQVKRDTYSCVVVRLESAEAFSDVDFFVKSRLNLELAAVPEVSYYEGLAKFFRPVQVMGWVMAGLIVVSGLFGGLNVMVASIAGRTHELACLEVLGFRRGAILLSLFQEVLLQVGTGTLIAIGLAVTLLGGMAVRFTMGAVELQITPQVLAAGVGVGLLLAITGTLVAGLRHFKRSLLDQLR